MLRTYLPALVFVVLGAGVGALFAVLNSRLGPKGRSELKSKADPYECGLPSEVKTGFRFGISFYLVGLMFIIFDLEVILLVPTAVVLRDFGMHGLISVGLFLFLLGVAFVYEWRRGALDWRD